MTLWFRLSSGRRLPGWLVCVWLLCAACGASPPPLTQVTVEAIPTPTEDALANAAATLEAVPTPESTPDSPITLSVWLPESFASPDDEGAEALLTAQIDAFQAAQAGVAVHPRLKRSEGAGGLMETLLAANAVAPSALPDLTLVRRGDLAALAQFGLAQPLDDLLSPAILGDLYPPAVQLGQVEGQVYGLPYALEIQHVAYRPPPANFARFDDLLAQDRPLVLPAGRLNGLNDVFLVQYLAAGGAIIEGSLSPVNLNALQTVLTFYQSAVRQGIIDPTVLNYPTPGDYQAGLVDGRITAAVVTSGMYLELQTGGQSLQVAPIPVSSGPPATLMDGWMWVVLTEDADRQAVALNFLNWLFDAERQSAYTRAVNMLPSQRGAMRQWGNPEYAEFAGNLLANAVLPLSADESSAAARAMQNALAAVILGERTAAQAANDVAEQLAG